MRKWRNAGSPFLLVLFLLIIGNSLCGQNGGTLYQPESGRIINRAALDQVHLQTLDQHAYQLSALRKKLIALVFLSPECPLCQNYSLVLNRLQARFGKDLDIVGIFPGKSNAIADCLAFQAKYHIQFLLLTDTLKSLVKMLAASITPEVFLMDQTRSLVYHGAIDNWVTALGKQRRKATENYLEDGIAEQLEGVSVKIKEAKPIGCFINDY
ncbi:MAG: redoxin domain-containing protein [Bacteroidota bacterium]|nr:redoxin domain-containing protein [Bacteroidota bacterium]